MADWYELKFLESATNVRGLVGRSTGRAPSARLAREIAVCIQQGRLYFEAAADAPIQIKPLLIYYGVVAFAQAVVVARTGRSMSTFARAHGVKDITAPDAGIEDLVLRVEAKGTFQQFNDATAPLGRLRYYISAMPQWHSIPFDKADGLERQHISLKEILARAPSLHRKFGQTFASASAVLSVALDFHEADRYCTLRIDDPNRFSDRASLVAKVRRLRSDYPFLERWRFVEAAHAWGNSLIIFDNVVRQDPNDMSDENLIPANNQGFAAAKVLMGEARVVVPAEKILPPLSGGFDGSAATFATQPISNAVLHEYSLQFLGSYLLSSLVRYRPQIWQGVISRSVTAHGPADDRSLSLIEEYLEGVLVGFPRMVVQVIDYPGAL